MLIQYDLNITIKGSVNVMPGEAGTDGAPETQVPQGKGKQLGDSMQTPGEVQAPATKAPAPPLGRGGDDSEETGPGGQPPGVPSIGIVPVVINCFCCCRSAGAGLEQQGGKPKPK